MSIPECKMTKSWTDCGYEYDCEYDCDVDCGDCICVTSLHDDLTGLDPRTGNNFNEDQL